MASIMKRYKCITNTLVRIGFNIFNLAYYELTFINKYVTWFYAFSNNDS